MEENTETVTEETKKPAKKTECPSGHEYSEENTYVSKTGARYCRTCRRDRSREFKRKQRAKAKAEAEAVMEQIFEPETPPAKAKAPSTMPVVTRGVEPSDQLVGVLNRIADMK